MALNENLQKAIKKQTGHGVAEKSIESDRRGLKLDSTLVVQPGTNDMFSLRLRVLISKFGDDKKNSPAQWIGVGIKSRKCR